MKPEIIDRQEEWKLKVDDFYKKVKDGSVPSIRITINGNPKYVTDRLRTESRGQCDCFGNRMLKTLFPVLVNEKIYWVGGECMEALQDKGLKRGLEKIKLVNGVYKHE